MSLECDRVGGSNLSQGTCDARAGRGEAGADGVEEGFNTYTRYDGLDELRRAIAARRRLDYGLAVDPSTEIVVSAGATGALYCVCLALLDPGDEVVLFEPYYGYHVSTLLSVGAVPAYVPMRPPDWTFAADDLERAVTPRTRAILVNTPGNPSGQVFTRDELGRCRVAGRHDLFVFTDGIYDYFVYDAGGVAPASVARLADRTINVQAFSRRSASPAGASGSVSPAR
jgi:aminotransferase